MNFSNDYNKKYLKYKNKYNTLKNQYNIIGGNIDFSSLTHVDVVDHTYTISSVKDHNISYSGGYDNLFEALELINQDKTNNLYTLKFLTCGLINNMCNRLTNRYNFKKIKSISGNVILGRSLFSLKEDDDHITSGLFKDCINLETITGIWFLDEETDMSEMFSGCINLTSIPQFSTSISVDYFVKNVLNTSSDMTQIKYMQYMFFNTPKLNTTLNWIINPKTITLNMFINSGCKFAESYQTRITNWFYPPKNNNEEKNSDKPVLDSIINTTKIPDVIANIIINYNSDFEITNNDNTEYFCSGSYNEFKNKLIEIKNDTNLDNLSLRFNNNSNQFVLTSDYKNLFLKFKQIIGNIKCLGNMSGMFNQHHNLKDIDGDWDMTDVIDMKAMFSNCNNLNYINGNWNMMKVEDMSYMFSNCKNFYALHGNWKMNNVVNMKCMFSGCSNLKYIKCVDWNVSNVNTMECMFDGCYNLQKIDCVGWDVSKVENMSKMFYNCVHLIVVNGKWDTSSVINMNNMFYGCVQLNSIPDITTYLGKIKNINNIFVNNNNKELSNKWIKNITYKKD
jgi:surface protein